MSKVEIECEQFDNDLLVVESIAEQQKCLLYNYIKNFSPKNTLEVIIFFNKIIQNEKEILMPISSVIIFPSDHQKLINAWCLNNKNYTIIHGFTSILLLIPDKLAAALEVNMVNAPNTNNGCFLIKSVIDLLNKYIYELIAQESDEKNNPVQLQKQILILSQNFMSDEEHKVIIKENYNEKYPNDFKYNGFLIFLKKLRYDLHKLDILLCTRKTKEFIDKSNELLTNCDIIYKSCYIFHKFIMQIWIDNNKYKKNKIEDHLIILRRIEVNEYLENNNKFLFNKFNAILVEKSITK